MKKTATLFWVLLLTAAMALPAFGQTEVTVREINAIDADNLVKLNAAGATLDTDSMEAWIESAWANAGESSVQFTAVILSAPNSSGLSSSASRIHVMVRDTSANSMGNDGMSIQVVDGNYATTGLLNTLVGDVVTFVGEVQYFGAGVQFVPASITLEGGYGDFALPATILDPVTLDIADVTSVITTGHQANWDNFAKYNNEYVRFENVLVFGRNVDDTGRPNFAVTNGAEIIDNGDVSLRFRNDRAGNDNYPSDTWNVRDSDDPFTPPPPGARGNFQGFLLLNTSFDPYGIGEPAGSILKLVPFEDSDVEITETPPVVSGVVTAEGLVSPDANFDVSADVVADAARTITGVVLKYRTSIDAEYTEVAMSGASLSSVAATYSGSIDAANINDGDFVEFFVEATDSEAAAGASVTSVVRALSVVNSISDIQMPFDAAASGDSPLDGLALAGASIDLVGVVNNRPGVSGYLVIQDDAEMSAWSGVLIQTTEATDALDLQPGDSVRVTSTTIDEQFGVTRLEDIVLEKLGSSDATGFKTLSTTVLQDADVAESYEGMMVKFESVTIINNDAGFGEWTFSSDGTADNAVRADDASSALGSDFSSTTFANDDVVDFHQGIWWYSFGNYKLIPEDLEDVANHGVGVERDGDALPGRFALDQNYPNPFNPVTTISYAVGANTNVTLEVFDMLGRRVMSLVNGQQTAGTYTVTFDGQELSSGMYIYRLAAGTEVITRKMTLLK